LRLLNRYMGSGWLFDDGSRSTVRAGLVCARAGARSAENLAEFFGYIVVHRTGVSLLLGDAKLWEFVDEFVSFDFQLPRQHVNADLIHRVKRFACLFSLPCFRRTALPASGPRCPAGNPLSYQTPL